MACITSRASRMRNPQFCVSGKWPILAAEWPYDWSIPGGMTLNISDVAMGHMTSQITGISTVCSTMRSGAYQTKYQSSKSPFFVRGIHRWPVNSPHKGPVKRKIFPFDNVIMTSWHSKTHTHTYVYIYMCVCVFRCASSLGCKVLINSNGLVCGIFSQPSWIWQSKLLRLSHTLFTIAK